MKKQYVRVFQTLPEAGAVRNVPDTVHDSVFALERTVLVLVRRSRRPALYDVVALHVASEQCRSHLGHETVRQVSIKNFCRAQTGPVVRTIALCCPIEHVR